MKKLISSLLLVSFIAANTAYAQTIDAAAVKTTEKQETQAVNTQPQQFTIPAKLEAEIKASIVQIYGKERCDEIYNKITEIAAQAVKNRSAQLKADDIKRSQDWYKDEIIYMFYTDQFGVTNTDSKNTFKDTERMFGYLKDLGVTTLYMLPFADSPMQDSGFDVKNPRDVRSDLGGMKEFKDFITKAKQSGFKIKADLVLNHFSQEHEWFKDIEKGDLSKLDYFIVTDEMPLYKKYQDEKLGTVVEYFEKDGSVSKRRLIFPENTENHWRKVTIKGKDYYFYHTFYPFQLDINWENPEVLYYCLETISYWCNMGIDIFRMDAIPYLSKEPGTNAENQPKTHAIIRLLSNYIQATAPSSVIQVEACQHPKDILPYFGKERTVDIKSGDKTKAIKRTDEAQIAYHFPFMPAIWASLITKDKKYFFEANKETPAIPESATWAIFLRVHDELTLEMVTPEIREIIHNGLVKKGADFRKGFGVSGRMANFLDNDPDRIGLAFSILMSLPGVPIIYYGDEIGARNNFKNAKEIEQERKARQKKSKTKSKLLSYFDSRDIHRGNIPYKLFYGSAKDYYEFNSKVYKKVKNLIQLRKELPVMSRGQFILLNTKDPANFAYIRKDKDKQIIVVNNLSDKKLVAEITLPVEIILKNNGHIRVLKNLINDDNVRVNLSLKNKTMHLRVKPYDVLWLEL